MEFTGLAFMDAWIFQPQNLWSSWSFLRRLTQVCFTELGIGFASWKDFVSLLIMLESHSFWLWIEASHPLTGCLTCCEECGECLITDKKKFKTRAQHSTWCPLNSKVLFLSYVETDSVMLECSFIWAANLQKLTNTFLRYIILRFWWCQYYYSDWLWFS